MTQPNLFDEPDPDPLVDGLITLIGLFGYEAVAHELRRLTPTTAQPSAPARWTDPETSHRAAKREQDVGRFSAKSRQAKLLQIFASNDLTDQQATVRLVGAHAPPSAFDGCRRRCSDLRAVHYLFDTGRRRKNAGSDDESVVWGITHAGRDALHLLDTTGWSR